MVNTGFTATVSVLINQGNGTFAAHILYGVRSMARSIALGDLDDDGDADLAVGNEGSNTISVLLNQSVR